MEKANDYDFCIHEYEWAQNPDYFDDWTRVSEGHEKYPDIDHERLINVYEKHIGGKKVNALIIGAMYWPAYIGAITAMRNTPELYTDRESRVELHRMYCQKVKDIFTGN